MATVFIPSLMQKLTDGRQQVEVPGATVREVVNNLEQLHPGIKERLVDKFRIKPNISVAVDGEVSTMGMLEKVNEDSEVHFLPAIGGGSAAASRAVTAVPTIGIDSEVVT
jgi:molybdopterin synthase sulfur carrier subunit